VRVDGHLDQARPVVGQRLVHGTRRPLGKPAKNWIKTLPGKGWFTYFRLYGPTQPYFDRTWVLPDIKPVK